MYNATKAKRDSHAVRQCMSHTTFGVSMERVFGVTVAMAKKGTEHTPEEHMIISRALKHEKAQAHASRPALFMIPSGTVTPKTLSILTPNAV